jgi:hypothetical protein
VDSALGIARMSISVPISLYNKSRAFSGAERFQCKAFLGTECFQEQSVFRSRAFSGAERFQEQSVFRSRAFSGAKRF